MVEEKNSDNAGRSDNSKLAMANNQFSESRAALEGATPKTDKGTARFRMIVIVGGLILLAAFIYATQYFPEMSAGKNKEDLLDKTAIDSWQIKETPDASTLETKKVVREAKERKPPTRPEPKPEVPKDDEWAKLMLELTKNALAEEMAARKAPVLVEGYNRKEAPQQAATGAPTERQEASSKIDEIRRQIAQTAESITSQANAQTSAIQTTGQGQPQQGGIAGGGVQFGINGTAIITDNYQPNAPADPNDAVRQALKNPGEHGNTASYGVDRMGKYKNSDSRTIRAGTIINARTLQGINTDSPGMVRGQIESDVYDSITGAYLLVPKGSMVIGRYASGATYGDERVPVIWDRIQFRNGDVFNIGASVGADSQGFAGFNDKVDNKYGKLFGHILLLSMFNAVADFEPNESRSNQSTESGFEVVTLTEQIPVTNPVTGEVTIETVTKQVTVPVSNSTLNARADTGGFSEEFSDQLRAQTAQAGLAITRRNLQVSPTLKIRVGYPFVIQVTNDLIFEESYRGKG